MPRKGEPSVWLFSKNFSCLDQKNLTVINNLENRREFLSIFIDLVDLFFNKNYRISIFLNLEGRNKGLFWVKFSSMNQLLVIFLKSIKFGETINFRDLKSILWLVFQTVKFQPKNGLTNSFLVGVIALVDDVAQKVQYACQEHGFDPRVEGKKHLFLTSSAK